jgi:trimethylamine--corrinoid protein Co-methyltransferase
MARRNPRAGYDRQCGFGLTAFSEDELEAIHSATLQIFVNTGIKVESEDALEIFDGAGAIVERHDDYGLVKLPNYLVEDCIRWTPRTGLFYGRRPEDDYFTDGGRVGFTAGFGEHVQIIDPKTRLIRPTVKADLADITRIQDALDVIVVIERAACSGDQCPETLALHNYEAMVHNSSKHIFLGCNSGRNTRKIIEMAAIAAGGKEIFKERPTMTTFVCPTSPLTLTKDCSDAIIESARGGIGIAVIPMSLSGATSPATLGGVVVQHNVEVLSAIILAQLANRGTPCVYCGCSSIMDLRLGSSPVGVPEMALLSVSVAKLAQYYRFPSWVGACGTDSKIPDAQQAYDFTLTALPAALAGANIVYGMGAMESLLTFDYAAMITGAEQAERIMRIIGGIPITDESMVLDLIHEVGPGGNFMSQEHTYRHMRSMSQSKLFDRRTREDWLEMTGGKDVTERAYEEAMRIMAEHKPMPLPNGAAEQISALVADYEAELGVRRKA